MACINESGCAPGDGPCVQAACGDLIADCLGQDPAAPLDCSDLNDCLGNCGPDEACQQVCVDAADAAAVDQFSAIFQCIEDNGCFDANGDLDPECYGALCAAELNTCFGPPAVPRGGASCGELNQCFGICGDDSSCQNDCVRAASEEGLALFQIAIDCLNDSGCAADDGECQTAACGDEISACIDHVPPPPQALTCSQLNECLGDCAGDEACVEACREDSSPEAVAAFDAIIACITENECFDAQGNLDQGCYEQNCAAEAEACFGPPVEPRGEASCSELNDCLGFCGDDGDCQRRCVEATAPEAYDLFVAAVQCINNSGCAPDDGACIDQVCGVAIGACLDQERPALSCPQVDRCLGRCAGDADCQAQCEAQADPAALDAYAAIFTCIEENACVDEAGAFDRACYDENCNAEAEACFGPPAVPQGDATCLELNDCLTLCQGDFECQNACVAAAAPESLDLLAAASTCINESGCETNECVQETCGAEIEACVNDQ